MAQEKKWLSGLPPGWVNVNTGGKGFTGRHAENVMTGEAMSIRHVINIRAGKETLEEALEKTYAQKGETTETNMQRFAHFTSEFQNLQGAVRYAASISSSSYIVVYGKLRNPGGKSGKGDIGGYGHRAISTLQRPSAYQDLGIDHYAALAAEHVKFDSHSRYYVEELFPQEQSA